MKTKVNHRSSNDLQWQETKRKVKERDHGNCRFLSCLSASEYLQVQKTCTNKNMLVPTDCAHIHAVSEKPEETYNIDNIVFLCRYAHTCIDNCINPFTGKNMDNNYRWYLWSRIYHKKIFPYDPTIEYEDIYFTSLPLSTLSQPISKPTKTIKDIFSNYW